MAALTTTSDGTLNNTASSALGGAAAGTTDTVTLDHNVTIDADTVLGSSPSTGGTAALGFGSVGGKTLTINPGVTLTLKGDLKAWAGYALVNDIVMGAGSSLVFLPPSGQQYKVDMSETVHWTCNGTSGSPVTIKTDKSLGGLSAYFEHNTIARNGGITTATYLSVIDMGTSTKHGIVSSACNQYVSMLPISITNFSFLRSSYLIRQDNSWDQDFTFQNNGMTDSVVVPNGGTATSATYFAFTDSGSTGTRLIDNNSFDQGITFQSLRIRSGGGQFTNNAIIGGHSYFHSGCTWASKSQFTNNFFSQSLDSMTVYGPVGDNYFIHTGATNPHFLNIPTTLATYEFDGLLFEAVNASNDATGNLLFFNSPGSAKSCTITRCIGVKGPSGYSSGSLATIDTTNLTYTIDHNTWWGKGQDTGMIEVAHTAIAAGAVVSACSNLILADTASNGVVVYGDVSGLAVADAITLSRKNASWNAGSGTCKYNTSTSQASVARYRGCTISANSAYPNSQVGSGDVTVAADPRFAEDRRLGTWGASLGADGSTAGALALLLANPALVGQADTGLIAWVRDGYRVTDVTLKDAGEDGETIGAMGYEAASTGKRMDHRFLCPR